MVELIVSSTEINKSAKRSNMTECWQHSFKNRYCSRGCSSVPLHLMATDRDLYLLVVWVHESTPGVCQLHPSCSQVLQPEHWFLRHSQEQVSLCPLTAAVLCALSLLIMNLKVDRQNKASQIKWCNNHQVSHLNVLLQCSYCNQLFHQTLNQCFWVFY